VEVEKVGDERNKARQPRNNVLDQIENEEAASLCEEINGPLSRAGGVMCGEVRIGGKLEKG